MKACLKGLERYIANSREGYVLMNANESDQGFEFDFSQSLNRYPDNNCQKLRQKLADYNAVDYENIVVGNGSSEMLDLLMKAYIEPGDIVMGFDPSFVMYQKYTQIYGGYYQGVKTVQGMMDMDLMIEKARLIQHKLIFICNPNNPTGSIVSKTDIEKLLKATDALVVVDEAYGEYADVSMMNRLGYFDNLVILKTFSKAFGMASIRLGYLVGPESIVALVDTVRPPYNVNTYSQAAGIAALDQVDLMRQRVSETILERERLYKKLLDLGFSVIKSYSNYLFIETDLPLAQILKEAGILIRSFNNGTFRITISNIEDNNRLIEVLETKEVYYEKIV